MTRTLNSNNVYTIVINSTNPLMAGSVHNVTAIVINTPTNTLNNKLEETPSLALMKIEPGTEVRPAVLYPNRVEEGLDVVVFGWSVKKLVVIDFLQKNAVCVSTYILIRKRPPRPSQDEGYKPDIGQEPSSGYGQRPNKPNYNSQYASNYGNSQDNSIYVEIYDPPRPYRPHERPYYGISQGSSAQNYGQNYGHNSNSYNHGSWSQTGYGQSRSYRPQKPAYGAGEINDYNTYTNDKPSNQNSYISQSNSENSHASQSSYGDSLYGNAHHMHKIQIIINQVTMKIQTHMEQDMVTIITVIRALIMEAT
ncbi:unnamed protein product [Leptidea sinapis]|uniref:Peptidase S1 domain-containing protein n=1 Tax=Leptidea sinapis TaxID=189913 RepID=A0A5E4PZF4_9NEOP|nr:unnamed protein product [Leptidea sinapis]